MLIDPNFSILFTAPELIVLSVRSVTVKGRSSPFRDAFRQLPYVFLISFPTMFIRVLTFILALEHRVIKTLEMFTRLHVNLILLECELGERLGEHEKGFY